MTRNEARSECGPDTVIVTNSGMAPTKKSSKSAKKEKVFHPESRKAEQLARKQLRKSKLAGHAIKRAKLHSVRGKCGSFFIISSVAPSEAGPACEKGAD